eukprot:413531_1
MAQALDEYRDVIVNKDKRLCLIRVDSQKSNISASAYQQAFELASASYGQTSSSGSWKKAFSPFLSAGFVQVKPGKKKNICSGRRVSVYFSICGRR